jgi:hypothetical protein
VRLMEPSTGLMGSSAILTNKMFSSLSDRMSLQVRT